MNDDRNTVRIRGPLRLIYIAESIPKARNLYIEEMGAAFGVLEQEANSGNGDAAAAIAHMYLNRSISCENYKYRLRFWADRALSSGSPYGRWVHGWALFEEGQVGNALLDLEDAANAGFATAALDLGAIYQRGWGVQKDLSKSLGYLRLAKKLGHLATNVSILNIYVSGEFGIIRAIGASVVRPLVEWWFNIRVFFGPVLTPLTMSYPFEAKTNPRKPL